MNSAIYAFDRDHPDWTLLASIDESEPYEVDITEVWQTPTGYAIVTASGCSCWEGDYDVDERPTLDDVIAALTGEDQRRWNPSVRGAQELIGQLRP